MFSLAFLAVLTAAPPSPSSSAMQCERLCLATVQAVGVDVDERMVLEAALVRALDAPRCGDPVTVDDACFSDDECVRKTAAHAFVAVRAVHAGSELRLTWAAVHPAAVARGSQVIDAQKFYASGALDRSIASGACTQTASASATTTNATTNATNTATNATSTAKSAPIAPSTIAIGAGIAVAAVSIAAFALSASTIEDATSAGKAKETAFTTGWLALGGFAVGVGAAVVGVVLSQ